MEKTFVIKIMYNQHATWQGTVDWICQGGVKKTQHFRSALELIRLIDSSMDNADRQGWDDEKDEQKRH